MGKLPKGANAMAKQHPGDGQELAKHLGVGSSRHTAYFKEWIKMGDILGRPKYPESNLPKERMCLRTNCGADPASMGDFCGIWPIRCAHLRVLCDAYLQA